MSSHNRSLLGVVSKPWCGEISSRLQRAPGELHFLKIRNLVIADDKSQTFVRTSSFEPGQAKKHVDGGLLTKTVLRNLGVKHQRSWNHNGNDNPVEVVPDVAYGSGLSPAMSVEWFTWKVYLEGLGFSGMLLWILYE